MSEFNFKINFVIPELQTEKIKTSRWICLLEEIRGASTVDTEVQFITGRSVLYGNLRLLCTYCVESWVYRPRLKKLLLNWMCNFLWLLSQHFCFYFSRQTFLIKNNYALMKSVHIIYNRGASASESFGIMDLNDLIKINS